MNKTEVKQNENHVPATNPERSQQPLVDVIEDTGGITLPTLPAPVSAASD